jgi:4-hydroxy-tetrahydrodipicolinate reductase
VVVHGAAGKMGATVCQALAAADGFALVGAVDPSAAGRELGDVVPGLDEGSAALVVAGDLGGLDPTAPDDLVDFSRPDAALAALAWCLEHRVDAVSGTTGFAPGMLDALAGEFARADRPNAVVAPNFSISAVLLIRLAEIAAVHLDAVEIIEYHHDQKRDAPSGTALETARRIAAARAAAGRAPQRDPTTVEALPGARGGVGPGAIHLHAVRLPGFVAHEEVILAGPGQALTIRQDSFDRTSFMPGVLAALARVAELPGLTVGLDAVLGL